MGPNAQYYQRHRKKRPELYNCYALWACYIWSDGRQFPTLSSCAHALANKRASQPAPLGALVYSTWPPSLSSHILIGVESDGHRIKRALYIGIKRLWVYPKKYAHGFCFVVVIHWLFFFISIRLISLALRQSNDCPSASKATLMNMDKYFMWIHYERLHNHNKTKHNKTVCIFLGIYCTYQLHWRSALPGIEQSTLVIHLFRTIIIIIMTDGHLRAVKWFRQHMMTSSNGNIFRVTCPLCGEFTGHRWIPHTKASGAELWCFRWSTPEINGWANIRVHCDVIVMIIIVSVRLVG